LGGRQQSISKYLSEQVAIAKARPISEINATTTTFKSSGASLNTEQLIACGSGCPLQPQDAACSLPVAAFVSQQECVLPAQHAIIGLAQACVPA
jgi:hypothetical protein